MVNIIFNNKNYTIDDTILAASTAELKSHLSTTMSGTGATITLDGVSYGVDSAKLTAATNDFVTHLGTVAGNGYKVIVNGVEYGVDSAKMTVAVSELEAVLDGSHSGGDGESSVVELPAVGTPAEDCTWAQIKAIGDAGKAEEYFNLRDTKTFTLNDGSNTQVVMEIVAFNSDDKADGSGKAAITWLARDVVAMHEMNPNYNDANDWNYSGMRVWLQETFYYTLPSELQDIIVSAQKTYGYSNGGSYITKTCSDKIWIPSAREIFGEYAAENSGVDYASLFKDEASRIKYDSSGSATSWWLRSATYRNNPFIFVAEYGRMSESLPNEPRGVVSGFCT